VEKSCRFLRVPRVLLASHFRRPLVVAQPEIYRVPQLGVRGPFGEPDLGDEFRTRPVWPFVCLRPHAERALFRFEWLEELHHARQLAFVEAGAGMADVDQGFGMRGQGLVGHLIYPEQQRAEVRPRLARLGPPSDDEFLLVGDFDLAPVRCSLARLVQRRGVLRDQSLPSTVDRLFVERACVATHDRAETDDRWDPFPRKQLFQRRAALDQRPIP